MNIFKKIFLLILLNLISAFALACALGGPSYALPLNSEYSDVHYAKIGSNLNDYLKSNHNISDWEFVKEDTLKILAPDFTDSRTNVGLTLPSLCEIDYQCGKVILFVLSSLPIANKFKGIKEVPDSASGLTAIINDVERKTLQGYRHIGSYNINASTLEIQNRVNLTERENIIYIVLQARNKTGKLLNFITGKRVLTSINTCSARYWSLDNANGAQFNNEQWENWNNYYYRDYNQYIKSLGAWMEPYRLTNPKIYKE